MNRNRITAVGTVAALALAGAALTQPSQAATPASGSIDETDTTATWEGGPFLVDRPGTAEAGCLSPADPTCDHYQLTIDGPGSDFLVTIEVTPEVYSDDFDIHVFDESGDRIATGETYDSSEGPAVERVVLADPPDGTYTVSVLPFLTQGGAFDGAATLTLGDGHGDEFEGIVDGVSGVRIDSLVLPCTQATPRTVGIQGITDPGERVSLDVHFLLDGISVDRAAAIVEEAAVSYRELGIDLRATHYDTMFTAPSAGDVTDLGGGVRGSITIDDLFAVSKAYMGGVRPDGADLVFTMTDKEIGEDTDGNGTVDDKGVLGVADCIGGVAFDDRAFGIGEAWADNLDSLPFEQHKASTLILSHELGHLMGAHHHYGECVTGQRPHETNRRVDPKHPCTLMFPSAGPNNLPFSVTNSAVVRGHAFDYARP